MERDSKEALNEVTDASCEDNLFSIFLEDHVAENSFENAVVEDSFEGEVVEDSFEKARENDDDADEGQGTKNPLHFDLNEPARLDFDLNKYPEELGEEFEPKGREDVVRDLLRIYLPRFF